MAVVTRRKLRPAHVMVDGLRLFVRRSDAPDLGEPLLLVHGAVISGRYMQPTVDRLDHALPVLVPDLPGFGHSPSPRVPYDVPGHARALVGLLDRLHVARAHLVGHSLGAQVVAELAVTAPERVASVVLVGPTVEATQRSAWRQLVRLAIDVFRERPALIPLHLMDILRAGPRFALSTIPVALADRIETKLPRITAPTLVVCGDRDPLASVPWCRSLAAMAPHGELAVLEGPHALNFSRADALAAVLDAWLQRVGGPGRAYTSDGSGHESRR